MSRRAQRSLIRGYPIYSYPMLHTLPDTICCELAILTLYRPIADESVPCRQRLPTDSLLIGFLSPTIFLIIWAVICYLVLRCFAQLHQLRCLVSCHSFIPIWETYHSRWTKRMVLESLNRNRASAREILRLICRTCICYWTAIGR